MKPHLLQTVSWIPKPIEEVFAFFSQAENLNKITPPELRFEILTPSPIPMAKGTRIDYRIFLFGIPMKWETHIAKWEPPFVFVDEQMKGPYRLWVHEHRFESIEGKTKMTDTIRFLAPGGWLEPLVHFLFVSRRVKAIFEYREKKLAALFAG